MNRWAAAFPILGFSLALLLLAPTSNEDFPRAAVSLLVVVIVSAVCYAYVRIRTRATRHRIDVLSQRFAVATTVMVDVDSLELAAHIGNADAPRAGRYALVGDTDGIRLFSGTEEADVFLPWREITSVDLNPTSLGQSANVAISVFTRISPRHAINLIGQSKYGILRPRIEAVGRVIARLRELQGR